MSSDDAQRCHILYLLCCVVIALDNIKVKNHVQAEYKYGSWSDSIATCITSTSNKADPCSGYCINI